MALTRERKILIGAVALAVGAFLTDRVFLGGGAGPEEAEAGMGAISSVAATTAARPRPAAATVVDVAPGAPQGPSLAQRLSMAAASDSGSDALPDLLDAFAAPQSWMPAQAKPEQNTSALTLQEFQQRHKLDAVMHGSGGGFALVNGKAVKPGQALDGFELTSLGQRSATFRGPAGQIELQIAAQITN